MYVFHNKHNVNMIFGLNIAELTGVFQTAVRMCAHFRGSGEAWRTHCVWWFFFLRGLGLRFSGGAWSHCAVWNSFSLLDMCPMSCSTSAVSSQPGPATAVRKMACKATGNSRQPCLWVQRVMQCCLHWTDWWLGGRHLSVQCGFQKASVSSVTSNTTSLLCSM